MIEGTCNTKHRQQPNISVDTPQHSSSREHHQHSRHFSNSSLLPPALIDVPNDLNLAQDPTVQPNVQPNVQPTERSNNPASTSNRNQQQSQQKGKIDQIGTHSHTIFNIPNSHLYCLASSLLLSQYPNPDVVNAHTNHQDSLKTTLLQPGAAKAGTQKQHRHRNKGKTDHSRSQNPNVSSPCHSTIRHCKLNFNLVIEGAFTKQLNNSKEPQPHSGAHAYHNPNSFIYFFCLVRYPRVRRQIACKIGWGV